MLQRHEAPGAGAGAHDEDHAARHHLFHDLVFLGRRVAGGERRHDDTLRAKIGHGAQHRAVRAAVGIGDLDAREARRQPELARGRRRMDAHRPAVDRDPVLVGMTEHAEIGRLEGLRAGAVRLGDLARGVDLVVEHRQHAHAARFRRAGDAHRVQQVEEGVGREPRGRALRPHQHHRLVRLDGEIEEIGGLLKRRRAVGDGDAVHFGAGGGLVDDGEQLRPDGGTHRSRGDGAERHRHDVRHPVELRHLGDQLPDFHHLGMVHIGGELEAVVPQRRDRAAGADHRDGRACHGLVSPPAALTPPFVMFAAFGAAAPTPPSFAIAVRPLRPACCAGRRAGCRRAGNNRARSRCRSGSGPRIPAPSRPPGAPGR